MFYGEVVVISYMESEYLFELKQMSRESEPTNNFYFFVFVRHSIWFKNGYIFIIEELEK